MAPDGFGGPGLVNCFPQGLGTIFLTGGMLNKPQSNAMFICGLSRNCSGRSRRDSGVACREGRAAMRIAVPGPALPV